MPFLGNTPSLVSDVMHAKSMCLCTRMHARTHPNTHTHTGLRASRQEAKKHKKENKRLVDIQDECVFVCACARAHVCVWVCLSVLEDEVGDYRNS